ncbi:MAG: PhnD/SsuA/transferrin family substrate-binding protein [Anaerolineaceae bacterium]|nr:PhnD/SsuA/transferrin family substrate-binding protein [Anaerolineaceae bacterium]
MQYLKAKGLFFSFLAICMLAQACNSGLIGRPESALSLPQNAQPGSPTPLPTYTPTPAPMGSENNPLLLGLIAPNITPEQQEALNTLQVIFKEKLNLHFNIQVFPHYFALEEALLDGKVALSWLGPVEYILASQKKLATVSLVSMHAGVKAYGTQFFANKDSRFQSFFDPSKNISAVEAAYALSQFNGTKGCFISKKSLAGYWVPMGYLTLNNIQVQEPIFTQSSTGSLRSLYIKGVCDFAVTYSSISDPRTASTVITDLNDILNQVPVIWASPAIIPNQAFAYSQNIDLPLQIKLSAFLIQFSNTPEGREILSKAMDYEINGLFAIPDSTYDTLRSLLKVQELRLSELVNQP